MDINSLDNEFKELICIAQDLVMNGNTSDLTISEFIQLVVDTRNSERTELNLVGKNLVLIEEMLLQ